MRSTFLSPPVSIGPLLASGSPGDAIDTNVLGWTQTGAALTLRRILVSAGTIPQDSLVVPAITRCAASLPATDVATFVDTP